MKGRQGRKEERTPAVARNKRPMFSNNNAYRLLCGTA
jgi:hypothetical protein